MAENNLPPKTTSTKGAIDVLYFPPAGRRVVPGEAGCHEPVRPVVSLKKECGLGYVLVTQCKRWLCDRRIYCDDTCLDDVLRYTSRYPEHFIGIAGYNPLDIGDSTHQAEIGVLSHGFRGVYVHPGSFGITINDRRMYPLYVKALEWAVPVMLDVRPLSALDQPVRHKDMDQVAGDFPELTFVVAQPQWSGSEMLRLVKDLPNVYFCVDAQSLFAPALREVLSDAAGQERCMWGSNGLPWKEALSEAARLEGADLAALLRENAVQVFGLDHLPACKPKPFVETEKGPTRIVAE